MSEKYELSATSLKPERISPQAAEVIVRIYLYSMASYNREKEMIGGCAPEL